MKIMNSTKMKKRQLKLKKKQLKSKNKKYVGTYEKKLWSVLPPEHNLPKIGNQVRLYHYTKDHYLSSILEHGLIKGDVFGGRIDGHNYNAPNLTAENEFHNPANKLKQDISDKSYLRLEIYFDADDKNIIPYAWFDKNYCKNQNRNIIAHANSEGNMNGNIEKQYLYKGYISPKMIKKVSAWNPETKYWDRLSKGDIQKLNNPFNGSDNFDWGRIVGFSRRDWTGELENLYKKIDNNLAYQPVYKFSDWILDNFENNKEFMKIYREGIMRIIGSEIEDVISPIVAHVFKTVNWIQKADNQPEIEWNDLDKVLNQKYLEIQEKKKEFEEILNQPESEVA